MSDHLGYVVIEYNQASHMPSLGEDTLFDDLRQAAEFAKERREFTAGVGRAESYAIAEVTLLDLEDWQ